MGNLSVLIFALLVGGALYALQRRVHRTILDLWAGLSEQLGVPLEHMSFEGRRRVDVPVDGGALSVSYLLSVQDFLGVSGYGRTCITRYKGGGIPEWFEYRTQPGVVTSVRCDGVDLSAHTSLVFDVLFGDDAWDVQRLKLFITNVHDGSAMFESWCDARTPGEEVARRVGDFARAVERLRQVAVSPKQFFAQLLSATDDPELFGHLVSRTDEAHLRDAAREASPRALGLWCVHGWSRIVREHASLSMPARQEAFASWAKHAPLAHRAGETRDALGLIAYFCEQPLLQEHLIQRVELAPQLALPMLTHHARARPREAWELGKQLVRFMRAEELNLWLERIEAAGAELVPAHLLGVRLSVDTRPEVAQQLATRLMTLARAKPDRMNLATFNQTLIGLLLRLDEETFDRARQWLTPVATRATLEALRAHLDHRTSREATLRAARLVDQMTQRLGRAGGLSLSQDAQTGGLSVSEQAQQGQVTFAFEDHEQAKAQPQTQEKEA